MFQVCFLKRRKKMQKKYTESKYVNVKNIECFVFWFFFMCNILRQRFAVSICSAWQYWWQMQYTVCWGPQEVVLLLDILAGLYISSVFFVTLWYEEEKSIQNLVCFVVTQTCFNWIFALCSSPCFTVVLAAWAKYSICKIWSVIVSERKMIVLLFAFYALCHF